MLYLLSNCWCDMMWCYILCVLLYYRYSNQYLSSSVKNFEHFNVSKNPLSFLPEKWCTEWNPEARSTTMWTRGWVSRVVILFIFLFEYTLIKKYNHFILLYVWYSVWYSPLQTLRVSRRLGWLTPPAAGVIICLLNCDWTCLIFVV